MTVIRPNSVSGITSITAQANEINVFRSNGLLAGLNLNGVNFNTTAGISTLAALKITGNLDIAGVLTYQDVTNVDSIGIITARSGINVSGGQLDVGSNIKLGNAGVITATSFVGDGSNLTGLASDKIEEGASLVEVVDTGTGRVAIKADGSHVARFATENGNRTYVVIGNNVAVGNNYGSNAGNVIRASNTTTRTATLRIFTTGVGLSDDTVTGIIDFAAQQSGTGGQTVSKIESSLRGGVENKSDLIFSTSNAGSPTEKLRLTAAGHLGVNVSNPLQSLHVAGNIINTTSVMGTGDQGINMGSGHRLGFDQSGTRSWTLKAANSNLTFNSGDGNGAFDFNTTAHLKLPSGTTAQRVNSTGALRYNSSLGNLEFYDGSSWKRVRLLEAAPTSGLLAYWPFSTSSRSGSTYNDVSGNNHHFTVNGTITDDTSETKFNGCIDFGTADGNHYLKSSSNSFVNIGTSSGYSGVSISVWVKTSGVQNQWIISEGTVNQRWNYFNESANAPKWRSTNTGDVIQSGSILTGNWHHLVVTYNSSNNLVQHYRDGSFINQGTTNAPSFNGEYLLVGQHSSLLGNSASYRWRGKMAHMRIYNRVLTSSEVSILYQQW